MLDVVEAIELRHAVRAEPELAHGLGPAKEEHGQERTLPAVERQCLVDHVPIAHGGPAMGGEDETNETLLLQLVEDRQHGVLVVVGHRLPVGCLVAGGDEGVQGEGVLLGSGELLFQERADHACRFCIQIHPPELTAGQPRFGDASCLPDVVLRGLDRAPRIDLGGVGEFLEESFHRRHFERAVEEEALSGVDVLRL